MQEKTDAKLLRDYAESNDEAAFREIVSRHAGVVYASALRQTGSPDLARDISQTVFADLARKARLLAATLTTEATLLGWLYRGTRFAVLNELREDRRRQARERQDMDDLAPSSETLPDWDRVRPVLDEAMAELADEDREVLLLRFFKNLDFRAIGAAFGISDDAAQKRASRALEKLRGSLASRGVTSGAGAISALLAAGNLVSAPEGLAAALSTVALSGSPLATLAITTKTIAMTTLQKTLVASALTTALATGIYQAHQASGFQRENQDLLAQRAALTVERDQALASAAEKDRDLGALQVEKNELARLRGEIGQLRRQARELEQVRAENGTLQAALQKARASAQPAAAAPDENPERSIAIAKMSDARLLAVGLLLYASENGDRLPANLGLATNFLASGEQALTGTNQFELVVQGSLKSISNPSSIIALREKEPSFINGKWCKVYGFVDGHSEVRPQSPEGFEAWENQHMLPPAGP